MAYIEKSLHSAVWRIFADQNYEQSFAFYRLWLDIQQTYRQVPSDPTLDKIWSNRTTRSMIVPANGKLIHSTIHLFLRFAGDAEADYVIGPHTPGLQSRLCAKSLEEFFGHNMDIAWYNENGCSHSLAGEYYADVNLVAHWANLGRVGESGIHNHILQSLISHAELHDHQADGLIILFKLAGATFEAYTGSSVVDRCFELIKDHYSPDSVRGRLVQEVIELRERGWEGLPPPPVFRTRNPKPTSTDEKDPAATPVVPSLGLPNKDPEPQIPDPPQLEPVPVSEPETTPGSPVTQSPTISIASLSDFTIADASDDESSHDPATVTPHDTFYLDERSVEVLCGNTLFRVHASTLSFHSPVLSQMFAKSNLETAESPNGCPRILSSDTATDFATLLKVIYLPVFPERNKAPDFTTFSSLLRMTTKYQMPAVRSQILEAVRDAYPETFEGLDPSKTLGESVFSGPTPHPNTVLNLFVQQNLTSALPMAYYMAVRRGPESLMGRRLPASARLPPETLQATIQGLFALREMELKETHRLIFGSNPPRSCLRQTCPSRNTTGPRASEAHQKMVDRLVDSANSGTKLLQVLSLGEVCGGDSLGFCEGCVEAWEARHADVRKKAWVALPDVFGLKLRLELA